MNFGVSRLAFVRTMDAPDTGGETVPITVTTALEAALSGEAGTISPPDRGMYFRAMLFNFISVDDS